MQHDPHDKPSIQLSQFLKMLGVVNTGGEAKILIQRGDVRVNGTIETRRGRRLHPGDEVHLSGVLHVVPPRKEQG
jgi:ribosome-associated protein